MEMMAIANTSAMGGRNGRAAAAIVLVGFFALAGLISSCLRDAYASQPRRRLLSLRGDSDVDMVYPWARNHLRPLTVMPEPTKETGKCNCAGYFVIIQFVQQYQTALSLTLMCATLTNNRPKYCSGTSPRVEELL